MCLLLLIISYIQGVSSAGVSVRIPITTDAMEVVAILMLALEVITIVMEPCYSKLVTIVMVAMVVVTVVIVE